MLPAGFLGTRADILMDLVLISFVVILPALCWSWWQVRLQRYAVHKRSQLILAAILGVTVLLFEIDLTLSGGIFALTSDSAYAGTALLKGWIYGHSAMAIFTSIVWLVLIFVSLWRFASPPRPNPFSSRHRFWGRVGMVSMLLAGCSAFPLYYYGFMQ
jgi:putative membrane protein